MRVFLAAPITGWCDAANVAIKESLRGFVQGLAQSLQEAGHCVFSAHRVEGFGDKPRCESVFVPFDFLELRRADLVVAFPAISGGVHLELGWASALRKPLILLTNGTESPLARGMASLTESTKIPVSPSFPLIEEEVARIIEDTVRHAVRHSPSRPRRHFAFVTTAFGFGPAAKAVAIAKELRRRQPDAFLDFFGCGIDHDFAVRSDAFDRVIRLDVDDSAQIPSLVEHLALYDDVVSVMNFEVARACPEYRGRLHIVDSLAWMWSTCPAGAENATHYFIQRYLVDDARLADWSARSAIYPVGPIRREQPPDLDEVAVDPRLLLVNLSGCANPLIGEDLYREYATLLGRWVIEEAEGLYDRVTICVQQRLADVLAGVLAVDNVEVAHLAPDDFTRRLASAGTVLTSPGITTTLEAVALGKMPHFLLAQNYSQALLNERNLEEYPTQLSMAFSQIGPDYVVTEGLPEEQGVKLVAALLKKALRTEGAWLRARLRAMLVPLSEQVPPSSAVELGQREIVDAMLSTTRGPHTDMTPSSYAGGER